MKNRFVPENALRVYAPPWPYWTTARWFFGDTLATFVKRRASPRIIIVRTTITRWSVLDGRRTISRTRPVRKRPVQNMYLWCGVRVIARTTRYSQVVVFMTGRCLNLFFFFRHRVKPINFFFFFWKPHAPRPR